MYEKSIVASGHPAVSDAAGMILKAGGNAFDAVVAAGFASTVVEPALASLGGGGLLVGRNETRGDNFFLDFFVNTPGLGRQSRDDFDFFEVTVDFSGSSQVFNVGAGSVAVPGIVKGLLHTHNSFGRMPLVEVLAPAKKLAAGHLLNERQSLFCKLLRPILGLTAAGRAIYEPDGKPVVCGCILSNPDLVQFLDQLAVEGDESFYRGELARKTAQYISENGGLLTFEDLQNYKVVERKPLVTPFRKGVFVTPSEPSQGGSLIALSLSLLARMDCSAVRWESGEQLQRLVGMMKEVEKLRVAGVSTPDAVLQFLADEKMYSQAIDEIRLFSRGTTHISVADRYGNCASMTGTNGEGSGYFVPGTGVMLNNMMGEDDLHPDGFHTSPAGQRVYSMMAPSLYLENDRVKLVIGSGGSKRIRTAISQVLLKVVDFDMPLQEAVDGPRLYLDEELLQVEPGFAPDTIEALKAVVKTNVWPEKDVYFGGVHAVIPGREGAGDKRRGGNVVTVLH